MRKEKNINFDRIRGVFQKPLNVLALLLIIFFLGSILTIITIYTKDKPTFIPEEARGSTRGAIIENIGEPLKSIFEPLGSLIVDAAYVGNNQPSSKEPETKNTPIDAESKTKEDPNSWPLYVDTESGISIRHPDLFIEKEMSPVDDYRGTISFWGRNNERPASVSGLPVFDIDLFSLTDASALDWVYEKNSPIGIISEINEVKIGDKNFVVATRGGSPDHLIYVFKGDSYFYMFKTSLEGKELIEDVLKTFSQL